MKKTYWIIALLMFMLPCSMSAQVVIDNEDEDETELIDDEEGDEDDEDLIDEEDDEDDVISDEDILVVNDDEDGDGNIDDVEIDVPEALSVEVDSLLNLYHTKQFLTQDESCDMPDVNPVYDTEVYIERLKQLPTAIEMPHNEVVQKFIDRYSGRLRRTVGIMLGLQNFYMPIFEQALETYGLPLELTYLPVLESALKPTAVSRVGATGLWQFMLATGKQYGLEVNSLVDERRDPIKSSYAAARYLKALYRVFGDWNLVIAAYNCGPENINKAIRRARAAAGHAQDDTPITKAEKDYWHIYPYLPAETRGYVPAFIAANYIMTYYCDHNICPMTTRLPAQTDTIMVHKNVHLQQIAGVLGLDIDMLRSLNPEFRHDVVPGLTKPYAIRLPLADTGRFIDHEDSIYAYRADELLNKRIEVTINDDVPTYKPKKTRATRRNSRASRNKRVVRNTKSRRTTAAKRRTPTKKTATRSKTRTAKKKTTTRRRRR